MRSLTILFVALFSVCVWASDESVISGSDKRFPEVTFDSVQEIFGHNLDTDDTLLKTLLLAVGMDHTSNNSPHVDQNIGIPFIVDRGPGYWVARLKSGERKLEVLVNNALLLLFTKEKIPNAKDVGFKLLQAAADLGYWPADYYVAESNLTNHLTMNYLEASPQTGAIEGDLRRVAQDTMDRYNRCAEIGFAPCQYRIGFWLSSSQRNVKEGLNILQQAIYTTMSDTRYKGALDGALVMAAKEIVFKGDQVGLDEEVREEYANLIKRQVAMLVESSQVESVVP